MSATQKKQSRHSTTKPVLFTDYQIGAFRKKFRVYDPYPDFRLQAFPKGKVLASKKTAYPHGRAEKLKLQKSVMTLRKIDDYIMHGTIDLMETCLISYENPAGSPDGMPERCSHSTTGRGVSSEPIR